MNAGDSLPRERMWSVWGSSSLFETKEDAESFSFYYPGAVSCVEWVGPVVTWEPMPPGEYRVRGYYHNSPATPLVVERRVVTPGRWLEVNE